MGQNTPSSVESETSSRSPQLSPVLIHLLKGVLYRNQHPVLWDDLKGIEAKVIDYFKIIGLELAVDEAEGFAYLKQSPMDEDGEIPRLIHRRPLSYPVSLLCVLMRKKMVESDAGGGGNRVVLSRSQIVEMMRVFSPQRADEAFTENQIAVHIHKAVELDLLRELNSEPPAYEIRPIVKALVDADWLASLDEKIKAYQEHGNNPA